MTSDTLQPTRHPALTWGKLLAGAILLGASIVSQAAGLSSQLAGQSQTYTVREGDTVSALASRFGLERGTLLYLNRLQPGKPLQIGQQLQVDNRHIVPTGTQDGISINLAQRMLYLFRNGERVAHYPIAVGAPDWQTPRGEFRVLNKQQNKTWYVPKSIQEEMRNEGKVVKTSVPPGPDNPLGKYWVGLSLPRIGIHGTIAPTSIYNFESHGCMRMHPDDVEQFFNQVRVGDRGRTFYQPVMLAQTQDGRVWLEVHRDAYGRGGDPLASAQSQARQAGLYEQIDWERARQVVQQRLGIAQEVTLGAGDSSLPGDEVDPEELPEGESSV